MTNEKAPAEEKAPRKKSQKQLLIEALLGLDPDPSKHPKLNWANEMKFLGRILKKIPDTDFWFYYAQKSHFPSLVHLLCWVNETTEIYSAYFSYTKNNKLQLITPEIKPMEQNKVGEDIIVPQPKKTLLDFINS